MQFREEEIENVSRCQPLIIEESPVKTKIIHTFGLVKI